MERNRYADGRKSCRWERRVGSDWVYGLGIRSLTSLPLYERTQLKMGLAAGWTIVLCESESSVDAIQDAGVFATTWAGGASSPPVDRLRRDLAGATVVWIPDNDEAGQRCSVQVVAALDPVCSLRTIMPAQGQDARDLLVLLGGETFRDIIDGRVPAP
jgi:DNA primase